MLPTPRHAVHPMLRTAAQETGRLCAMIAGYAALIGLFVLAGLSLWLDLPSAVAESRLVPGFSAPVFSEPAKLRGTL